MAKLNGLAIALDVTPPSKPKRPARPRARRLPPAPPAANEQGDKAAITLEAILAAKPGISFLPFPEPRLEVWRISYRTTITLPLMPKIAAPAALALSARGTEPLEPTAGSTADIPGYVGWLLAFCLMAGIGGLWLLSSWIWLVASWV